MSLAGNETPLGEAGTRCEDSRESARRLGVVLENRAMGPMVHLEVQVPEWAPAKPGQFALLQTEDSGCFLGRALSVSDQSSDTVSFLVAPVGKGTREICETPKGSKLWVLGPLGNGFDLESMVRGANRVLLVGGGAGIAPFPLLVKELARFLESDLRVGFGGGPDVVVLAGFRDSEQALSCASLVEQVSQAATGGVSCRYESVVEDESAGQPGRATDLLERNLRSGDHVVVCGPEAMAEAVWQVCRGVSDVNVWFSLETNMACGVGSCHGCVVRLADGSYARVCKDGPVFSGEDVFGCGDSL